MTIAAFNRIIGYVLLLAGLLLIILPLFQTYFIFTGKAQAPQIFQVPAQKSVQSSSGFDIQAQVQQAVTNALPIALLDNLLNLISWTILLFIFIFGGKQLAFIGIKLIKEV